MREGKIKEHQKLYYLEQLCLPFWHNYQINPLSKTLCFLYYVWGKTFYNVHYYNRHICSQEVICFIMSGKSVTPYCFQESYLGLHRLEPRYSIHLCYDACVQTVYIVSETRLIVLFEMQDWLKSILHYLSLVNFSRRTKGRSPDVKLLLWGNAFTHVMSRKWPSGTQRISELKSNCFFSKHWAINL